MATILEEFNLLKAKIHAGKGQEKIHVVYHEAEKKRRRENPEKSTRVVLNTYSPEAYSEFSVEKDRFFSVAVDPHLAIHLMIRALKQVDDATLRTWLAEGHHQEGDRPPDLPKAEIPNWLK